MVTRLIRRFLRRLGLKRDKPQGNETFERILPCRCGGLATLDMTRDEGYAVVCVECNNEVSSLSIPSVVMLWNVNQLS